MKPMHKLRGDILATVAMLARRHHTVVDAMTGSLEKPRTA
jgi:hypothetical protein